MARSPESAGCTGPLNRCSIYDGEAARQRLNGVLAMGLSRPWPEALEALTGGKTDGCRRDFGILAAEEVVGRAKSG